jgi:hypothetical protein
MVLDAWHGESHLPVSLTNLDSKTTGSVEMILVAELETSTFSRSLPVHFPHESLQLKGLAEASRIFSFFFPVISA